MKTRSVREIFIQPKIFHSIGFHHQGLYQIKMQLIHQKNSKKKQFSYGYPQYIFSINRNSIPASEREDPLNQQLIAKKSCFLTQRFNINFNDQSYSMNYGVIFHIQFQNEENLTYLEIELIKIEKEEQIVYQSKKFSAKIQSQKTNTEQRMIKTDKDLQKKKFKKDKKSSQKTRVVGKKRMYINISLKQENKIQTCFQNVFFSQSQFYSCMYFFIEHVKIYQKIRLYDYQISQFQSKTPQQKIQLIQRVKLLRNKEQSSQSSLCPNHFQCQDIEQVYRKIMIEPLLQYNNLSIIVFSNASSLFSKIEDSQEEDKIMIRKPKKLDYIIPFQNWKTNNKQITSKSLKQKYKISSNNQLISQWYQQSLQIGQNIRYVWRKCVNIVVLIRNSIFLKHCIQANQKMHQRYSKAFQIKQKDTVGKKWSRLLQQHAQRRKNFFKKQKYYFSGKLRHPMIIISEKLSQKNLKSQRSLMSHQIITIFVHGYKGNQYDISKMKANLSQYFKSNFYVLKSIQNIMEENIQAMGQAAAKQVLEYLNFRPLITKRVNFVGFSLGGIIIRSMVQKLEQIKQKLNVLITFATPHLGVSKLQNCIVKFGMCCMTRFGNIKNMQELRLTDKKQKQLRSQNIQNDSQQIKQAYLMKLSKSQSLSWFNHVILIGSQSDQYVPSYSAILDYEGNDEKILSMQKSIEKNVRNLHKINVWFDTKQNVIDWISRRKGHISFLDNDAFLDFFFAKHWKML